MKEPGFIKLVPMREENDCVIACIATYLGTSYEDALRAAMLAVPNMKKEGYTSKQIRNIAKMLGFKLRLNKAKFDLSLDIGILLLRDHVCVVWRGVLWDPSNTLWDAPHYLKHFSYEPIGLFVVEKDDLNE